MDSRPSARTGSVGRPLPPSSPAFRRNLFLVLHTGALRERQKPRPSFWLGFFGLLSLAPVSAHQTGPGSGFRLESSAVLVADVAFHSVQMSFRGVQGLEEGLAATASVLFPRWSSHLLSLFDGSAIPKLSSLVVFL